MKPPLKNFAIVLCVAGVMLALLFQVKRAGTQSEYMSLLHSLQGTNITKVVMCEKSGSILASVSAPVALGAFAKAANTAEPYRPNHPNYAHEFHVLLYFTDGQYRSFEFYIMQPSDQTIYVNFVQWHGAVTSYYGHCKSTALFDWMKKQIPTNLP